jgi:hypothetical protein
MKYDLHTHSKYSYDSSLDPEKMIQIAKKKSLSGIAITDHNTIKGGLTALKNNRDKNFDIIVGTEIKTEIGDIMGLFLNEEITIRNLDEVIDEIRSQGGLVVLPHPYRQFSFPEKIVDNVDIIETFNARSKKIHNRKAQQLAEKYKKPIIAGSDAHLGFEIGRGVTVVENDLRNALEKGETEINGEESNYYVVHGLSVFKEKIKRIMH